MSTSGRRRKVAASTTKVGEEPTLGTQKSRREIAYDDSQSDDSDSDTEPVEKRRSLLKTLKSSEQIVSYDGTAKVVHQPNTRFSNYQSVFKNMIKTTTIPTDDAIVNCVISFDSTLSITITKKDENESTIMMHNLESYEQTFEMRVGGNPNQYIKVKEVEQNSRGDKYAIGFLDDGKFFVRTFDKNQKTDAEFEADTFDINKAIGLDDYTMPIHGNADPFIVCEFIDDENLFVALFNNNSRKHYHFIYSIKGRKIASKTVEIELGDTARENHPVKAFYNSKLNEIYVFYKLGQGITIPSKANGDLDIEGYEFE